MGERTENGTGLEYKEGKGWRRGEVSGRGGGRVLRRGGLKEREERGRVRGEEGEEDGILLTKNRNR
jgi:hypothetical protein